MIVNGIAVLNNERFLEKSKPLGCPLKTIISMESDDAFRRACISNAHTLMAPVGNGTCLAILRFACSRLGLLQDEL